jgi:ribosome maturation factor RimP
MRASVDRRELAEKVEAIAAPIVRSLHLELVGVECSGQGSRTVLRVFIDKPGGVTLGDCEQVHLSLGHALDVEDPIPHAYTLEVSSPGLDRPLRRPEDFRRNLGKRINVKLAQPLHGQWRLMGRVQEVSESGLTLACGPAELTEPIRLEWNAIAEAKLEIEF